MIDLDPQSSPLLQSETASEDAVWILPETLRELADEGDTGLIVELIEAFRTDTSERLIHLRDAIAGANGKALRAAAHTIKGSARQMGANRLAGLCQELELAADAPAAELLERLAVLEVSFADACRAMAVYA